MRVSKAAKFVPNTNRFRKLKNAIVKKIAIFLFILFIFSYPSSNEPAGLYKKGTAFSLTAKWWNLSADGTMKVIGNTKCLGKNAVIIRSQVTEMGGFLGFIVKFLRIYKESNTFDSYIEADTLLPLRYEVYKLKKDGSKKLNEHVYFDRESRQILSADDGSVVISNAEPDAMDTFSAFLYLVNKFSSEKLFVGKKIAINLYAYKKISKVEIDVVGHQIRQGKSIYSLEIRDLPEIFKYPASVSFDIVDEKGYKLPTNGRCIIDVPVIGDITINGDLKRKIG